MDGESVGLMEGLLVVGVAVGNDIVGEIVGCEIVGGSVGYFVGDNVGESVIVPLVHTRSTS
jgi:hypothetical protein